MLQLNFYLLFLINVITIGFDRNGHTDTHNYTKLYQTNTNTKIIIYFKLIPIQISEFIPNRYRNDDLLSVSVILVQPIIGGTLDI